MKEFKITKEQKIEINDKVLVLEKDDIIKILNEAVVHTYKWEVSADYFIDSLGNYADASLARPLSSEVETIVNKLKCDTYLEIGRNGRELTLIFIGVRPQDILNVENGIQFNFNMQSIWYISTDYGKGTSIRFNL